MKRKTAIVWFTVIVATAIVAPLIFTGQYRIELYNYLPGPGKGQFIVHNYYSLMYNESHEQADWLVYKIDRSRFESVSQRTDRFMVDDSIITGSATNQDYARSGYDRGHLAPAADMSFSDLAMKESFYYSNISPQLPGFNRGIWKSLEENVRSSALTSDSVYIFTGPVYKGGEPNIGPDSVTVPAGFFKITLSFVGKNIVARSWLVPHESGLRDLSAYSVTVDSIEVVTGIDFFPGLPDRLEKRIEKQSK